ncbi:MAG: helix-turn-helix domain-containing protein [Deltaproteobacteria bacterium]|nr:helix-turn-helix domain-containing protein [Deltaproteobacteria bacterium]
MPIRLRLAELLEERHLSVEELSRRTGVSRVNLSRLRSGRAAGIRFATLDALCDALEVLPGDLFEHAPSGRGPRAPLPRDQVPRDAHQQAVLDAVQGGPLPLDDIAVVTGLRAGEVAAAVTMLEVAGLVRRAVGAVHAV